MKSKEDPRSQLPSVDQVLQRIAVLPGMESYSHEQQVQGIRMVLENLRQSTREEEMPDLDEIVRRVEKTLVARSREGIHRVVNATGVVLHTNLGRAVLPREAMDRIAELEGCCNLQIDLETGLRGQRDDKVEELLYTLTGAEAATVVNNNAAATLLVLAALCKDREVIVSRGQLIEIGGSFRLPDVIAQSGARMVEVGTTNKTHLRDYENAITEETSVLLRVNPSNYRIVGFTQQVSTAELVGLKKDCDLIVVDDLGCGALVDLSEYGLPKEPTVQDSIKTGADVALFSGDKLIGGPQAGIIVGKKKYIDRIRKHPLARALRVGKFTIAALEATLELFLHPDTLLAKNPTLRMLTLKPEDMQNRAKALAERLSRWVRSEVIQGLSACGGGALPDTPLSTVLVAIRHDRMNASELARQLRCSNPPVITRVQEDWVHIDIRTLLEGDEDRIEAALQGIVDKGDRLKMR